LELAGFANHDQPIDENGPFLPDCADAFPHHPEIRVFFCATACHNPAHEWTTGGEPPPQMQQEGGEGFVG
jgi:hypothetical protein